MELLDPTMLTAGMPVITAQGTVLRVSAALVESFEPGDELFAADTDLIHIKAADRAAATAAVDAAANAFAQMGAVSDAAITEFFEAFAERLADDATFAPIAAANLADVEKAKAAGRSTTRLVLSDSMRADMISGLREWASLPSGRGEAVETVTHEGWSIELVRAGLGVIGFIFEGRPNVFADACGVLRSGNTVVFRIGSDALGTARAIVENALQPSLIAAGLPVGAASLVDSVSRGSGHAMFSDTRLALAVARGSGAAVAQLGSVARQRGIPVSLHGTGGAWIVVDDTADAQRVNDTVIASLDRKVCNTVNTVCVTAGAAESLVPAVLDALDAAAERLGTQAKLHATDTAAPFVPADWHAERSIERAEGTVNEPGCEPIAHDALGTEWEWERSPEISLVVVDSVDEAVELFNRYSPHFVASLISGDEAAHETFFEAADAPFVGDGFTRWVDGQYALGRPELGLSNWQNGRLLARGGVLSGDSVFTLRARVRQSLSTLRR
jgi:glutamate-5-semialdehyde dehydrogenase